MRGSFCILIFSENFPAGSYVLCCGSGRFHPEMFCQSLIRPCSATPVCRVFLVIAVVEDRALDGDQRITLGFSPALEPVLFRFDNLKMGSRIRGCWYEETILILPCSNHTTGCSHIFICSV